MRLAFDDFAGLDAAGADANALASTVDLGLDWLEVDVPAATGGVVGVRDVVAELRAFAAKITFVCHDCSNPESQKFPGGSSLSEKSLKRCLGKSKVRGSKRTPDLYRWNGSLPIPNHTMQGVADSMEGEACILSK